MDARAQAKAEDKADAGTEKGAVPKAAGAKASVSAVSLNLTAAEMPSVDVETTTSSLTGSKDIDGGEDGGAEGTARRASDGSIESLNSIARSFSELSLAEGVSNSFKRSAAMDTIKVVVAATAKTAIARALACSHDAQRGHDGRPSTPTFVASASSEEVRDLRAQVRELESALRSSREMHYEELDKLKVERKVEHEKYKAGDAEQSIKINELRKVTEAQRHERLELDQRVQSQHEALARANEEARAAKVEFEGKERVLRNMLKKTRQEKQEVEQQFQQRMADEHCKLEKAPIAHSLSPTVHLPPPINRYPRPQRAC